jgi:hypothetical protein
MTRAHDKRKEPTMSKTNTGKKRPAYRIYSVTKEEGKDPVWQEIGVAWTHNDGKGLNLQFNALPLPNGEIVLRVPKPRMAESEA